MTDVYETDSEAKCPFCGAGFVERIEGEAVYECGLVLDPQYNAIAEPCEEEACS